MKNKFFSKDFSLILSGGSALGFSHLGVIKFLDENKYIPQEIVGTSMEALIGAAYASGLKYEKIQQIIKDINYFKLFSPSFSKKYIINYKKIREFLFQIFENKKIKDLKIDLKITSTNFDTGEIVIFDKKSNELLIDILCSSFAIPGIFEPFKLNKINLVDGFLSSNLPIEVSNKKIKNKLAINVVNFKSIEKTPKNIPGILRKSFIISIINQTKYNLQINSKKMTI